MSLNLNGVRHSLVRRGLHERDCLTCGPRSCPMTHAWLQARSKWAVSSRFGHIFTHGRNPPDTANLLANPGRELPADPTPSTAGGWRSPRHEPFLARNVRSTSVPPGRAGESSSPAGRSTRTRCNDPRGSQTRSRPGTPRVDAMPHEHILWIALAAYGLHILEEYELNWRDWARNVLRLPVDWGSFTSSIPWSWCWECAAPPSAGASPGSPLACRRSCSSMPPSFTCCRPWRREFTHRAWPPRCSCFISGRRLGLLRRLDRRTADRDRRHSVRCLRGRAHGVADRAAKNPRLVGLRLWWFANVFRNLRGACGGLYGFGATSSAMPLSSSIAGRVADDVRRRL